MHAWYRHAAPPSHGAPDDGTSSGQSPGFGVGRQRHVIVGRGSSRGAMPLQAGSRSCWAHRQWPSGQPHRFGEVLPGAPQRAPGVTSAKASGQLTVVGASRQGSADVVVPQRWRLRPFFALAGLTAPGALALGGGASTRGAAQADSTASQSRARIAPVYRTRAPRAARVALMMRLDDAPGCSRV